MGKDDFLLDMNTIYEKYTCKACNKEYECVKTEQTPGFRDMEENRCPYCGNVNEKSMTYDYSCYKTL